MARSEIYRLVSGTLENSILTLPVHQAVHEGSIGDNGGKSVGLLSELISELICRMLGYTGPRNSYHLLKGANHPGDLNT